MTLYKQRHQFHMTHETHVFLHTCFFKSTRSPTMVYNGARVTEIKLK